MAKGQNFDSKWQKMQSKSGEQNHVLNRSCITLRLQPIIPLKITALVKWNQMIHIVLWIIFLCDIPVCSSQHDMRNYWWFDSHRQMCVCMWWYNSLCLTRSCFSFFIRFKSIIMLYKHFMYKTWHKCLKICFLWHLLRCQVTFISIALFTIQIFKAALQW